MKRPTMLIKAILAQANIDLDLSVERDVVEIQRRCEHEGLSFLTITLPLLSDALERGLEEGRFSCPTNFSRHGSLPRLLGGFFNRVFARSGELLPEVDAECIMYIRQICRFFKKLKMNCSPSREAAASSHFLEVESELGRVTPSIRREDKTLDETSKIIWYQVFPDIDPLDIICRHGPGATADRASYNKRHRISHWYARSELMFPSDLHVYPNYGYAERANGTYASVDGVDHLGVRDEPGVRVVFVPKTQTSPRVIAIEPSPMQYIQQGLLNYIVPRLESHRLTKLSVHFTDQTINQRLAHRASIDKRLATLDLKDASDRVHFELVQRIFSGSGILEYLEDARSLHATLPNGRNVILNKFASMGSAICFPVEAMVFYTIIQSAFHDYYGKRPTSSSIRRYSRLIDIYGDDIIVPVELADTVVDKLESYGLRVNVNKSFRSSLFRESCGGDYYNGRSVKPVYARLVPPDSRRHWTPSHVMSWVSAANQFYEKGMWHVTQVIREMVESAVGCRIPRSVSYDGEGMFFSSVCFTTALGYDPALQGYRQRRIVYQPTKKKDDINDDPIASLNLWHCSQRSKNVGSLRHGASNSGVLRTVPGRETSSHGSLTLDSSGHYHMLAGCVSSPRNVHALSRCSKGGRLVLRAVRPMEESDGVSHRGRADRLPQAVCPRLSDQIDLDNERLGSLRKWMEGLESFLHYAELPGQGLDTCSSTKRGAFRSKRRWVTLIT